MKEKLPLGTEGLRSGGATTLAACVSVSLRFNRVVTASDSVDTLVRDELVAAVKEHTLPGSIHMFSQVVFSSVPSCAALLRGLVEAVDGALVKLRCPVVLLFDSPWDPPVGTKKGRGIETFREYQSFGPFRIHSPRN